MLKNSKSVLFLLPEKVGQAGHFWTPLRMLTIMLLIVLLHVSMFIYHLQGFFIMYAQVTKLIKRKHLYKWLLQRINRLKPLKTS